MTPLRTRKLLALLLAGTWLPVTISCQPQGWEGVVRVVTDGWRDAEVLIEELYEPWYYDDGCCGYPGWGGFHFNFEYDD